MSDVTRDELERRLGEEGLVLARRAVAVEFSGQAGYPCDARHGSHPRGAARRPAGAARSCPDGETIRELVGAPEGAEVIAYCHSGSRSAIAVQILFGPPATRRGTTPARGTSGAASPALPVE